MPRAALIENGLVINLVAANDQELNGTTIVAVGDLPVSVGWSFSNGEFTAPVEPPLPVPAEVTMRQARLALRRSNLLANVQAAINSLPEPSKTDAQIEWDYSNTVQRSHAFTQTLGAALGLTSTQMDDLFRTAATL